MRLIICAQYIGSISFGLLIDKRLLYEKTIETLPESYLLALDQILKEWEITIEHITQIMVVSGPGSFTASRVSITIANAIAFAREIPIQGIENAQNLSLMNLLSQDSVESAYVIPAYGRPPDITKPTKQ